MTFLESKKGSRLEQQDLIFGKGGIQNQLNRASFAVPERWQNRFGICWKKVSDFAAQNFYEHPDISIIHSAQTSFDF